MTAPEGPAARLGDRSLFPTLEARVYANHAAVSPPSRPVRDALHEAIDDFARRGVAAITRWRAVREEARARVGRLLGAEAADIAFVGNTTQGVLAVALCFPWRRGDGVVLFEGEFPTNVTPWQQAVREHGLSLHWLPVADYAEDPGRALGRLEEVLRGGRVRLVAVSSVQFQTGLRMPVAAMARLCHAHGAEIFVDAIQSVGALPVDVAAEGVDYLAAGGHKWLMAVEGIGVLYVHPERARALRPNVAGWLSHEDGLGFLFRGAGHLRYDRPLRARADLVEGGMPNTLGAVALDASTRLLEQLGPAAIARHVGRWLDRLEGPLVARGFASVRAPDEARRSGILSLRPPEGVGLSELHDALAARGVSCAQPDGHLRFAPHWPNHEDEVPVVVEAVDDALAELRRR